MLKQVSSIRKGCSTWVRWLRLGTSGAVSSEYVLLLGAAGLVISAAIVSVGPGLVSSYGRARTIIVSPSP
jgi:hypothetical protein